MNIQLSVINHFESFATYVLQHHYFLPTNLLLFVLYILMKNGKQQTKKRF